MAVKTEQQLLAECAQGAAITSDLMTDVINTIFSRGSDASASVFLTVGSSSDTIENMLATAGISLSSSTLIAISNSYDGNPAVVTLFDDGSGNISTVTSPYRTYSLVLFTGSDYFVQNPNITSVS